MNNVLDYGLDRVTNPNEVKVNQVSLMHSGQGLGEVLRLGEDPHVYLSVRQCYLSLETDDGVRV